VIGQQLSNQQLSNQPIPQQLSNQPIPQQYPKPAVSISEQLIQEIVVPVTLGVSTFASFEVMGDNHAAKENPRIEFRQQGNMTIFTPISGKQSFRCEVNIEGSNSLRFKLQTTTGGLLIKQYTMSNEFSQRNLTLVGNSIELLF